MKKIILTAVFSSLLSAVAVAEEPKMKNDNPNASVMEGKHMMNNNPKASAMEGQHMMNDNPYSSHPKDASAAANANSQVKRSYSVIKYEK